MKRIYILVVIFGVVIFPEGSYAQYDPSTFTPPSSDQQVIVIPGGNENAGALESIINNDVDEDGKRMNPNRIYQLEAGSFNISVSPILFGRDSDENAVLTIVGEEGGTKPQVFIMPPEWAQANEVKGSLVLKNVYWPVRPVNDLGGTMLFQLSGDGSDLTLEDCVFERPIQHDVFSLDEVKTPMNITIKNCYFRDLTHFNNAWNFAVLRRGDNGEPIDSLWVENTTISNGGMPFFGKKTPVNFAFFDHNTIVNTSRYPIWFEQYKEAYFTNNMFINCLWQGETSGIAATQMPGGDFSGVINVDPINDEFWTSQNMTPPAPEEVIFLSANNLHFVSPFLDKYYNGGFNDIADAPIATKSGSMVVENVPPMFQNQSTTDLLEQYDGMIALDNILDTDPQMVTKGIADQNAGDQFAKAARDHYGVSNDPYDKSVMFFGDDDPTTLPSNNTEVQGGAFTDLTEFPEDFSYTADIVSTIDGKKLGALGWWGNQEVESYNGKAALNSAKVYFTDATGVFVPLLIQEHSKLFDFQVYPVPANNVLKINAEFDILRANIYDPGGKLVKGVELPGLRVFTVNISSLANGLYFIELQGRDGHYSTGKIIKAD